MEYLFLCSMGQNRSPTAASVAVNIAKERGLELRAEYGGIDLYSSDDCLLEKQREHFSGFDKIFVMELHMKRDLIINYGIDERKIVCLSGYRGYL
jgi:predicted protein tyrosine phosphatase